MTLSRRNLIKGALGASAGAALATAIGQGDVSAKTNVPSPQEESERIRAIVDEMHPTESGGLLVKGILVFPADVRILAQAGECVIFSFPPNASDENVRRITAALTSTH